MHLLIGRPLVWVTLIVASLSVLCGTSLATLH